MGSSTIDSLKSLKDELYTFGSKNASSLKELNLITLATKTNDKNIVLLSEEIDIEQVKLLKSKILKHQQNFFIKRWWNWWFSNISQVQNIYYFCMARHTSMFLERKEPLPDDLRQTVSEGHHEYFRFSSLGRIYAYLYKEVLSFKSPISSLGDNNEIYSSQENLPPKKNSKISWLDRLGKFLGLISNTSDPKSLIGKNLDENQNTGESSQNTIVVAQENEVSKDDITNQLDNDPRYLKLVKFDQLFLEFKGKCFATIDRIICCLQYERQNYSSLPKYIDESKTKAFNLRKGLLSLIHPDKNADMREEAEINFKLVDKYSSWLNKVMDFVKKAEGLDYDSFRLLISEANDLHDDFRALNTADLEFVSLTSNFRSKIMHEIFDKIKETSDAEHMKFMKEREEAIAKLLSENDASKEIDRKEKEAYYKELSEKREVYNREYDEKIANLRKEMFEMFNNSNNIKQETNPISDDTNKGIAQAATQHGIFSTQAEGVKSSEKNVTDQPQAADPTLTVKV